MGMDWTGWLTLVILLAFCGVILYTIYQIGRYFKKKADKQ